MTIQDVTSSLGSLASILLGTQEPALEIGSLVRLPDGREGYVQNIRTSPYWPEECRGIVRVYVYSADWMDGARWTEWALIDECEVLS